MIDLEASRRVGEKYECQVEIAKSGLCLEHVVFHELVHLLVRRHDDRFVEIMNRCLPRWRALRAESLNGLPLAHQVWRE
jgi:predicted metal-dependent hydrolase